MKSVAAQLEPDHSVLALAPQPDAEWLQRLREALPAHWRLEVESAQGEPCAPQADLVVVGPEHPRPLWAARQIDEAGPRVHLVFLAHGEAALRLRQSLAFAGLRAGYSVLDLDSTARTLDGTLIRAAREVRQARRLRGTLDQVNALLRSGTVPAAGPPAGTALSESYLASLLIHLPKAVFSTDLEGRIVSWNPAAEALFGRMAAQVSGVGLPGLFDAADRPRVAALWEAARAASSPSPQGLSIERPDGAGRELSLLFAPIRHDSRVAGVLGFAEDITEQVQAQQERRQALALERQARARLQKALDSLAERERVSRFLSEASAVLASSLEYESTLARVAELAVPRFADWCAVDIVDEAGCLQRLAVACSERAAELPEGLSSLRPRQRRPGPLAVLRTGAPQLVPRITQAMLRSYAEDAQELRALKRVRPTAYMCLPLIARGQTLGTLTLVTARQRYDRQDLAVAREIAARAGLAVDNARLYRRAQHELAERERARHQLTVRARQQEAVARLGQTALVRGDPDLLLQAAARQVAETLEVELSDIQELSPDLTQLHLRAVYGWPAELLGTVTPASSETLGGRALAQNRAVVIPDLRAMPPSPALEQLRRHGAVAGISVVIPGDDKPYGVLGVFSHRPRRFSREDVSFLEAVASVIAAAVRRFELEAALRRQADELALADRRKNEFLAMLAHELRNPLGAVHNGVELLKLRGGEAEVRQLGIGVIARQVSQLGRMVDDLLDVARITSGRIRLQRTRVALADVIEHALQTGEALVRERRHALSVELPPEPVDLEADPARLAQVLTNLIGNAARYTEPGGRIAVRARCEGTELILSVSDTGCGIGPELLPHVFDLFVQSDHSLDRAAGGLGLGLTLVRQLTELHGGRVEAHSAGPGQGSEFVVRLPLPAGTRAAAAAPTAAAAVPARRVLVVEDNPDVGHMLVELLRGLGHSVRLAPDGESALERARSFEPEVVFLDVGLPGMDGYEVARRLREAHRGRSVVLAALSGYGPPQDADRAVVDYHLLKPARLEDLNEVLRGR